MRAAEAPPHFPHRLAGHCGSGALRDLLELHGLDYGAGPLSEGAAFGLAGGMGFLYLEMPGAPTPIYLVGRTADLERDISSHLGIGLEVRDTDDPEEGWGWVRAELEAGRPPMVWADIGHLDYLRVRMHNTRHDIVIVGADEDAGYAWIADNDREELQRCSLESLARARSSNAFPGPNRHTTFVYDWPERLRPPHEAVRAALATAVKNMRGTPEALAGLEGANGLNGVNAFVAAYPAWAETFGDELPGALKALSVFIVKAGTAGAMFRSLQAEFLGDMAALLQDDRLAAMGATYDELASVWRSLAQAARDGNHAAGAAVVETIGALERRGVEEAESWLEDGA